ncbi:LOW QUALITY PROTEIN: glutamate-rich protein 4 [Tachyglossus aculeatus]|uniref:LOW QUALITY PROTEIN: glutamate-rich protein 4 n=1 Tax=Tachyglossus aculeatus TaxID=9261 RepID=UPI0018F47A5D|nr:LOW QUALITY PROTEIN: glutamate-rich protein 4 [Tachyglossus aculeatus]
MDPWHRLCQGGSAPWGLPPPPRALQGSPLPLDPEPAQAAISGGGPAGEARLRDRLAWLRGQLRSLREVDGQLFRQLCAVGLKLGELAEDLAEEPLEEGPPEKSDPHGRPAFEMTI